MNPGMIIPDRLPTSSITLDPSNARNKLEHTKLVTKSLS